MDTDDFETIPSSAEESSNSSDEEGNNKNVGNTHVWPQMLLRESLGLFKREPSKPRGTIILSWNKTRHEFITAPNCQTLPWMKNVASLDMLWSCCGTSAFFINHHILQSLSAPRQLSSHPSFPLHSCFSFASFGLNPPLIPLLEDPFAA